MTYLKRLCLVAFALLSPAPIAIAATITATDTVTITGGTSGPPPQAVAAGMTIPALIQNFSTMAVFDHSCSQVGQTDTPGLWQVGSSNGGLVNSTCASLTWPYNDNGTQALRIQASPTLGHNRRAITTESPAGTYSVNFPATGYRECTYRVTSNITPTQEFDWGTPNQFVGSPWNNCWFMWVTSNMANYPNGNVGCLAPPDFLCYEYDANELHGVQPLGFQPQYQYGGGGVFNYHGNQLAVKNWTTGDTTGDLVSWCSQAPCDVGPVVDPSRYFTMGQLVTYATGDPQCGGVDCFRIDSYITQLPNVNNYKIASGWADQSTFGTTDHAAKYQRSYGIMDISYGCWNGDEGNDNSNCNNLSIATANSGGNLQVTMAGRPDCDGTTCICSGTNGAFGSVVYVIGLGSNVPDGTYRAVDTFGNCPDPSQGPHTPWQAILTKADSTPIPYVGPYGGSAIMNPLSSAQLYITNMNVWVSCSTWQTGPC